MAIIIINTNANQHIKIIKKLKKHSIDFTEVSNLSNLLKFEHFTKVFYDYNLSEIEKLLPRK